MGYIDSLIGLAVEELMSGIVGMIVPHAMKSIASLQLLPCDGLHCVWDYYTNDIRHKLLNS